MVRWGFPDFDYHLRRPRLGVALRRQARAAGVEKRRPTMRAPTQRLFALGSLALLASALGAGLPSLTWGAVTFGAKTDFATGFGPAAVAVADFNGDGRLDLAVANSNTATGNTVSILLGNGNGTFGAKTDFATGSGPSGLAATDAAGAIVDFDADGEVDLVTANFSNGTGDSVSVLLGTGTGTFGPKTDFATGFGPAAVAVADFNGDGKPDLVTANFGADTVSVLLNAPKAGGIGIVVPPGNGGASCFIVTAAFGSPLAPEVQRVREFRDRFLEPYALGRVATGLYYRVSPPLADWVARSEFLRGVVRTALMPVMAWVGLTLWSPGVGLGGPLALAGLGGWLLRCRAQRERRVRCPWRKRVNG
jgi:hypothetical protein